MKRSSVLAGVALFAVILGTGAGLWYYRKWSDKRAAASQVAFEPPTAVQMAKARTVSWRPTADLVGTVLSLRSVTVRNELAGRVVKVNFESGSVLEAGDIVLSLDDSTDQADLAAAKASVRVAKANLEVLDVRLKLARSEVERMEQAAASRAVAAMDLDRTRSELQRSEADRERLVAEVDQADAKVTQVQSRIDKMVVRAPFRARAGLRNVHEGQYLAEGTSVVMLEEVSDRVYLDFPIPQEYAPRVHPGLTVMATSEVLGPDPVKIEVAAVDAAVNNSTRNIRVRAVVDNKEGRLRPGMFVQIRVPVQESQEYVVVPSTAIRRASYADQVFVVLPSKKDGDPPGTLRAAQRFVKLGPTVGADVIVAEGLAQGEEVAASGSFKLRDGAKVMPAKEEGNGAGNEVAKGG
jgi:membrane fusion protein (multidrug efflux system)